MVYKAFLLGVFTLVSLRSVLSAAVPATSIHNCSGEASPAPLTYKPYFSSFGPQLSGKQGWEEWTYVLSDKNNQSMFHFQWTRGDPAAKASDPTAGTFSLYYEKIGFKKDIKGPFKSSVGDSSLSMSVGNNSLSFDGTQGPFGLWTLFVDIDGFKTNLTIDPVTPSVPFEPTLNGERDLLVPGYHVSHPVSRGHSNGIINLPSGLSWVAQEVGGMKHAYAYEPVQSLMPTYTRLWTAVGYNSLNWYVAEAKNGKETTAAQFVWGAPDFSELMVKYQVTNEPSILNISPSITSESHNYTVTLAGCEETSNHPYTFNTGSEVYLGAITDSAGGKTDYWTAETHVLFYVDGQLWTGVDVSESLGFLEVYTSPNN